MKTINFMESAAREKVNMPETWHASIFARKLDGFLITGAVCDEVYKSGPRKGEPKWATRDKNTEIPVYITRKELDDYQSRWETQTGLCGECKGRGEVFYRWTKEDGSFYKPCPKCGGTGSKPE